MLIASATKQWSVSDPTIGPSPSGRYGHSLNILGTKLYVFGGQVDGSFYNDLIAFDLSALQGNVSGWEVLVQNTLDGGPPQGQTPPARTNHTVITWKDKLILCVFPNITVCTTNKRRFGGTDGTYWFNDIWQYDPRTNIWSLQDCMGFIPIAREGHAAALVDDVMYVFGGRSEEGKDLGDLAAYRLSSRRWYSFQNMGPSPSPRSGHTMTAFGNKITILGGEPSSAPRIDVDELSMAYILDTGKIRYPVEDTRGGPIRKQGGNGKPNSERSGSARDRSTSRDRDDQTSQKSFASQESLQNSLRPRHELDAVVNGATNMRGAVQPDQPPTQQPLSQPRMTNGRTTSLDSETMQDDRSGPKTDGTSAAEHLDQRDSATSSVVTGQYSHGVPESPHRAASNNDVPASPMLNSVNSRAESMRSRRGQSSIDSTHREGMVIDEIKSRELNKSLQSQNTNESGVGFSPSFGQRSDDVSTELEGVRIQNSWYAVELALARKAGYRPRPDGSGASGGLDAFGDDDKPLIDAFFHMKEELERVQYSLQMQGGNAADSIAQLERQRDTAIAESVYAKARTAATNQKDINGDSTDDLADHSGRLSVALLAEKELLSQLRNATAELEAERQARQLAEDSASVALQRATDLDTHKQQTSSELESLRSELHSTHMTARQEATNCAEAVTAHQLLQVERNELYAKVTAAQNQSREHENVVASLRDAISSSSDKSSLLERKLDYERKQRSGLEEKLAHLTAEHQARVVELQSTTRLLQDAEELAESHAAEAKIHREAVLGLTKRNEKDDADLAMQDERVTTLQQRLEATSLLARKNQNAADFASDRLRKAEERIAGLETYQEQTSREGLAMRKHMQAVSRDALQLKTRNAGLERQLASEKLDGTAIQIQHSALKGLLRERGVDVNVSANSPDQEQLRQLERQVAASLRAHDEMRASFENQQFETQQAYEEKLGALDNDYQAAVKYLKGTEKMLSKMKQELHRYKTHNKELEEEASKKGTPNPDWTQERTTLRNHIQGLESRIHSTQAQVEQQSRDVQMAYQERDQQRQQVEQMQSVLQNLHSQNASLETRATEAERKAQFLLSTVGTTVNNYVRDTPRANSVSHNRNISTTSVSSHGMGLGHDEVATRNAAVMARNSMALDTLASELETLRSHWETTNKGFRSNGIDDGENAGATNGEAVLSDSLANWRKKLELEEEDSAAFTTAGRVQQQ